MAKSYGPTYKEENILCDTELLQQLDIAFAVLREKMKATLPIKKNTLRGSTVIGFGVDKTQRGIAADSVISIAKAIKALKGW